MRLIQILSLCICLVAGCNAPVEQSIGYNGQTMGTTYQVQVASGAVNTIQLKAATDSLLVEINNSLSTYIESSLISTINASRDTSIQYAVDPHFSTVFNKSIEVYNATEGAFNPAVGPLVSAWGFGAQEPQSLSAEQVDSLLYLADFDAFQWHMANATLVKHLAGANLDFSAIAKGYGVDAIAELLEDLDIFDYYVEIGGEIRTAGEHPAGRPWRIGIDKPIADSGQTREIQLAIELQDLSMATSGNYRNFYVKDGRKYVHTINPYSGYPEESTLLSVSVLAQDCMTADAYATAFMVMGQNKAYKLASETSGIEAYFISTDSLDHFTETSTAGFPSAIAANNSK